MGFRISGKNYNTNKFDVCPFVCLKLKISITAEPIGLYTSENKIADPEVDLSYFLGDVEHQYK